MDFPETIIFDNTAQQWGIAFGVSVHVFIL